MAQNENVMPKSGHGCQFLWFLTHNLAKYQYFLTRLTLNQRSLAHAKPCTAFSFFFVFASCIFDEYGLILLRKMHLHWSWKFHAKLWLKVLRIPHSGNIANWDMANFVHFWQFPKPLIYNSTDIKLWIKWYTCFRQTIHIKLVSFKNFDIWSIYDYWLCS